MISYAPLLIQGLFFGVAAGNIWSAPFVGGASLVGLILAASAMYFPARLQPAQRYARTALVALLAWPVAYIWQTIHQSAPSAALGAVQVAALLVGSQLGALGAGWAAKRNSQFPGP